MKMRSLAALCALLLLPCPGLAQDKHAEVVTAMAQAIDVGDEKGLDKLVKANSESTLRHFNAICWDWRKKEDEPNRKTLDALLASWARVFKTRTLEHYERYISSRSDSDQQTIYQAEVAEADVWRLYEAAKAGSDRALWESARDGARNLAGKYEAVGHVLFAARLWGFAGQITNAFPAATAQDKQDAIDCLQSYVRMREKWEWTEDSDYKANKTFLRNLQETLKAAEAAADKRKAEGYADDVAGADALVLPNASEEVVPLTFEVLKEPQLDMFVMGGPTPGLWIATQVTKNGPSPVSFFKQRDLFVVRAAANKYGVTTDGVEGDLKKNPWQPIEPAAKFRPSQFFLGPDRTLPYAMWFYTASEEEPLMGINHNLAPRPLDDENPRATIYYRSASSWTATIHGEPVVLYDDNANGKLFEEDPLAYGLRDRTRGEPQDGVQTPAYDGIKVGKAGTPQPWGSFVKIGDRWFHLRAKDAGTKIGARPLNPEYFKVGKIKLAWKGPPAAKPELLIVQGKGTLVSARYSIASGKELEVPVGEYEITFGRIAVGKGPTALQAQVFHGNHKPIEVKEGAVTTVSLGAPFTFDFVKGGSDEEVEIDAMKVAVHGSGGERYCRINGATPCPEVLAAKALDGKGAKPVGEFVLMSLDALDQAVRKFGNLGIEVCFFPVPKGDDTGNFVLKAKLPWKGALVGLQDKKSKLFGEIKPVFK